MLYLCFSSFALILQWVMYCKKLMFLTSQKPYDVTYILTFDYFVTPATLTKLRKFYACLVSLWHFLMFTNKELSYLVKSEICLSLLKWLYIIKWRSKRFLFKYRFNFTCDVKYTYNWSFDINLTYGYYYVCFTDEQLSNLNWAQTGHKLFDILMMFMKDVVDAVS